jgi:hypothetical protein
MNLGIMSKRLTLSPNVQSCDRMFDQCPRCMKLELYDLLARCVSIKSLRMIGSLVLHITMNYVHYSKNL